MLAPLIQLIVAIVIVGAILWGINELPLDPTLKNVARVILIVLLVIFAVYTIAGMLGVMLPMK